MNKYIESLDNIKAPEDLKERTVVSMINSQGKTHRFYGKKLVVLIITVIVLAVMGTFTVIAYNNCIYDTAALNFTTKYLGDGIVNINIYNGTDKDVKFQNNYKLCRWTTGELETLSDKKCDIKVSTCKSKQSLTIKINLNNLYDVEALEKEVLVNDGYYIIITDKNFVHEHDWQCSFKFNNLGDEQEKELKLQQEQKQKDAEKNVLLSGYFDSIDKKYMFYFESEFMNIETQQNYFDMVAEDIKNLDGNYVDYVTPSDETKKLVVDTDKNIVWDEKETIESQHLLWGEYLQCCDMTGRFIGRKPGLSQEGPVLEISVMLPVVNPGIGSDTYVPLFYLMSFSKSEITSQNDYTFIHGKFYTFEQIKDLKVYEDDSYCVYDISPFFYSDIEQYIEKFVFPYVKPEFKEQMYTRTKNIYNYFKNNLKDCFVYLDN